VQRAIMPLSTALALSADVTARSPPGSVALTSCPLRGIVNIAGRVPNNQMSTAIEFSVSMQ
jgi:hypothetical protein